MKATRCACGNADCKGRVQVNGKELWAENDNGREVLVYLDASAKYELITALRESIIEEASMTQ